MPLYEFACQKCEHTFEALVFDGHNDLPYQFRKKNDLSFRTINLRKPQKGLQTDIPRLRKGGVGAQFWSASERFWCWASQTLPR